MSFRSKRCPFCVLHVHQGRRKLPQSEWVGKTKNYSTCNDKWMGKLSLSIKIKQKKWVGTCPPCSSSSDAPVYDCKIPLLKALIVWYFGVNCFWIRLSHFFPFSISGKKAFEKAGSRVTVWISSKVLLLWAFHLWHTTIAKFSGRKFCCENNEEKTGCLNSSNFYLWLFQSFLEERRFCCEN